MSKELQAETEAQQGTNADVTSISHTCTKPNVGCSTILSNPNFKRKKILLKYWYYKKIACPIYRAFVIVPQHRRIKKKLENEIKEIEEAKKSGNLERENLAWVIFHQALARFFPPD